MTSEQAEREAMSIIALLADSCPDMGLTNSKRASLVATIFHSALTFQSVHPEWCERLKGLMDEVTPPLSEETIGEVVEMFSLRLSE
jgi:hypothetical protein